MRQKKKTISTNNFKNIIIKNHLKMLKTTLIWKRN